MRVIFFGTAAFAVPSLEGLMARHHTVSLCVTRPDRPKGRGLLAGPSPVKVAALRLGVPLAQPERLRADLVDPLGRPEVGVVAAYGQLIGGELLRAFRYGMLGVHPSLLPKYRGAAPVAWALLNGETATGVTIFRLNERLDAGDIIRQRTSPIAPEDTTQTLTERLAGEGAQELLRTLDDLASGRATFHPQDEAQASPAPKLTKTQGRIKWSASAEELVRIVRATTPWPGATTQWRESMVKICQATVGFDAAVAEAPGTVVQVTPEAIVISTGGGTLVIHQLQPSGRRRMSVKEFLAGHPVSVGERFGGPVDA